MASRTTPHALSPKQALFVKLYTGQKSKTFGNALQSALKAGYAREYAEKIMAVLSENVRKTMAEALEEAGLDTKTLAQAHVELLTAADLDRLTFKKDLSDEKIRELVASVPGAALIYVREDRDDKVAYVHLANHRARKDALELAYKVGGHLAPEKHEHTVTVLEDLLTLEDDPGAEGET